MDAEIRDEPLIHLAEHARIPIAFRVDRVFDLAQDGPLHAPRLVERPLTAPYTKDYDAVAGNHPTDWERRFDVSAWGLLSAWIAERRVGGAVITFGAKDVELLEGRSDLAVLWDMRVSPDVRGRGIGSTLFAAVERWALARGCRQLKVETQNVNVPACRFYESRGCHLGAAHPFAYPDASGEIQLLWYKDLGRRGRGLGRK